MRDEMEELERRVDRIEAKLARDDDSWDRDTELILQDRIILGRLGVRLEVLEETDKDWKAMRRTAQNAAIMAVVGTIAAFGKILWMALKSLFINAGK